MEKLKAFLKGFWSKGGQLVAGVFLGAVLQSNTPLSQEQANQLGQGIAAGIGAAIEL